MFDIDSLLETILCHLPQFVAFIGGSKEFIRLSNCVFSIHEFKKILFSGLCF